MRPWINLNDPLWAEHDIDLPGIGTSPSDGRLGIWSPIIDGRDAIVGSEFTPAPAAQQYAHRLQAWRDARRIEWMLRVTERLCLVFHAPEPF